MANYEIIVDYRPEVGMFLEGSLVAHDVVTGEFTHLGYTRRSTNIVWMTQPAMGKNGKMWRAECKTRSGSVYMAYWKAEHHIVSNEGVGDLIARAILAQVLR